MLMTDTQKPDSLPNEQESKKTGQKQNLAFCLINTTTLYIPQSQPSHILSYLLINRINLGCDICSGNLPVTYGTNSAISILLGNMKIYKFWKFPLELASSQLPLMSLKRHCKTSLCWNFHCSVISPWIQLRVSHTGKSIRRYSEGETGLKSNAC